MAISRIFDMSRRSLATYQKAMDITAHNIANASNENYSRQSPVFNTENPEMNAGFIWGTGVKIEQVLRVKNDLLERQICSYNQKLASSESQLQYLGEIEQIFSEPSDLGISNLMNQFFNSWSELSVSPDSITLRNGVINTAQNLSSKFGEIFEQFDLLKDDITYQFQAKTDEVNSLLRNISDLNESIYEGRIFGGDPNDLLDDRDAKITQLSKLVNTTITYDNKGGAIVAIGGITMVNEAFSTEFKAVSADGKLSLVTKNSDKAAILNGGEIFALNEVYGNKLPRYEADLNTIMKTIVDAVNGIHTTGYSITDPSVTGVKFFEDFTPGSLVVNEDIIADPRLIAVSTDGTIGNAELATLIADLADQNILEGGKLSDKYNSMINDVGSSAQNNERLSLAHDKILEQLKNQKASESGVSLDEEMANILKYQRSYDAAAKLIKIADEMLDSLMNIV